MSPTPEVYVRRKSTPDPLRASLAHRVREALHWVREALWVGIGIVLVICLYQYGRGVIDEFEEMTRRAIAAESRAELAERQVAEMLRSGDQGILLANINTDFGPASLRLVPKFQQGRD